MTWPTVHFAAAFDVYGLGTSFFVFSDQALRVTQLSIQSPTRNRLIDTFSAGTVTAVLDNADRELDPTNLSGSHVSGGRSLIVPNLPLWCYVTYGGTDYNMGVWFRDSGKVTWDDPKWSETVWTGTDGFKLLGRAPARPSALVGDNELSGDRITRILDNADWFVGSRSIDDGLSRMQGTLLNANPLAELQLVAASEGGEVWMAPDGDFTFKDRSYRTSTTTWTFSDASGTLDYTDLVLIDDDELIINYASITRVNGTEQVAEDTTSQGLYGLSTSTQWQRSDLVMSHDTEAIAIAQMAVDVYADAVVRFETMTVDPTVNDDLWPFVLQMRLGDRVTITRTPPGGGSAITRTCFIEGWRHDITPGNGGTQGIWNTVVTLSDATGWTFADDVWDTGVWDTTEWFY